MTAALLEARCVSHRTRTGKTLVDGVSLSAKAGEIVVLAGPNGAGKSTLLKMLAGLLPTTDGSITAFGQPLASLPALQRARRMAFVGQTDLPDSRLTARDYIGLGRTPHRRENAAEAHDHFISTALETVGLTGKERDLMGRLSGGEAQRAAIARALCQEPEILFLDEPTNHLDPRAKGDLLSVIARLGITVISVLHDLNLIPGLASHVVLLDRSKLVASGPTERVLRRDIVRRVFGVDLLHFAHPETGHPVSLVDIPIQKQPPLAQEL